MKRDIRNLFEVEEDDSKRKLKASHREEFYEKLKASRLVETKTNHRFYILKIAAMVVLFIAIGVLVLTRNDSPEKNVVATSTIELQIEQVEKDYLTNIDKEWKSFVALADDQKLVERYQTKLADLDTDYQHIASKFKQDSNNILVIEELVNNLKIRLQLLKDIQEHIKLLNQENEHHATINI